VTSCLALGWSSLAIGVVAVAVAAAQSDRPAWQLAVSLALAAFFCVWMWLLVTRRTLKRGPARPPAEWTVEPAAATIRRLLLKQIVFAATIAVLLVLDPAPAGVALGAALWQLATAGAMRRLERTTGARLLAENDRWTEFSPGGLYAA
jgi:hypothetical protein